jgi:hypothetical protein
MTYSLRGLPVMSIERSTSGRIQAWGPAHREVLGIRWVLWISAKRVAIVSLRFPRSRIAPLRGCSCLAAPNRSVER